MVSQVGCPCHVVMFLEAHGASLAAISRAARRSWKLQAQDDRDLHQEVSLRLLVLAAMGRAPDPGGGEKALLAWVRAVARRVARDTARADRRSARSVVFLGLDAPDLEAQAGAAQPAPARGLVDVLPLVESSRRSLSEDQLAAIRSLLDGPPSFWAAVGKSQTLRNRSRLLVGAARHLRRRWSELPRHEVTSWCPKHDRWRWQQSGGRPVWERVRTPIASKHAPPPRPATAVRQGRSIRLFAWHMTWFVAEFCVFA